MKSLIRQVPGFTDLRWCWYGLEQMKPMVLYDLLALRESIFVVEQRCIYQELDGMDKIAQHLLVTQGGEAVACLRLLPPGSEAASARIGRVAVALAWRSQGIAQLMVREAIKKVSADYPSCGVCLNAQTYLQDFYQSLGFRVCGDEYLEDGIPHIPMKL